MLFLWIFGNNVEDRLGYVKYILFYLAGGLAALALQTLVGPNSQVPTLGASGAIAAVLGAYIVLYPRARVVTVIFIIFFFTILELPAMIVLGIWFLQQALFGYFDLANPSGGGGGVAYFAHVGGFVFGLLAVRVLAKRPPPAAATVLGGAVSRAVSSVPRRPPQAPPRAPRTRAAAGDHPRRRGRGDRVAGPHRRHRLAPGRRAAEPDAEGAAAGLRHRPAGRRRHGAFAAGRRSRERGERRRLRTSSSSRARRCCSTSTAARCCIAATPRACCRSRR